MHASLRCGCLNCVLTVFSVGCECGSLPAPVDAAVDSASGDAMSVDASSTPCVDAAEPVNIEDLLASVGTTFCEALADCGGRDVNWGTTENCAMFEPLVSPESRVAFWNWEDVLEAAARGELLHTETAVEECLSGIGSLCLRVDSAGVGGLSATERAACRQMLRRCRPFPRGTRCSSDWECEEGLDCLPPAICGSACCGPTTCQIAAARGEACPIGTCRTERGISACGAGGRAGVCFEVTISPDTVPLGAACGVVTTDAAGFATAIACDFGLHCDAEPGGMGVCRSFLAEGETCGAPAQCGPGLKCRRADLVCVSDSGPDAIGGPCGDYCSLQAGSACVGGVCRMTDGTLGSPCDAFGDCDSGLGCGDEGACVPLGAPGEECATGSDCGSGCCDVDRCF